MNVFTTLYCLFWIIVCPGVMILAAKVFTEDLRFFKKVAMECYEGEIESLKYKAKRKKSLTKHAKLLNVYSRKNDTRNIMVLQ